MLVGPVRPLIRDSEGGDEMGVYVESEVRFTLAIMAEITLDELAEDGPEAFAKRIRELLEAKLSPFLQHDWSYLRPPARSAPSQDF
jgi:hypothetical protein